MILSDQSVSYGLLIGFAQVARFSLTRVVRPNYHELGWGPTPENTGVRRFPPHFWILVINRLIPSSRLADGSGDAGQLRRAVDLGVVHVEAGGDATRAAIAWRR